MLNKADFFEKIVRFEPDKIEESSGLNIKNTRKCLIISLEPKLKSKKSGLSGLTEVECT
jgi:hypothetical protein